MNKIKVLLIEDDRSISNFITATMDREGYKIMHALNGREGLSLSTSFCPNVILLDLGLPDMDGLEVLQKLRSWSDVPVIIISARTKEQEKVSALDLGADDYITKPFGTGELMARIRTSLRHSHAQTPGHVYKALDLEIDFEKTSDPPAGRRGTSDPDRIPAAYTFSGKFRQSPDLQLYHECHLGSLYGQ